MPPTLKDIALKAGVSITTASNALSGSSRWRINRDTLERVNRVAEELGYRPNAIARSLKSQRTDTVAFYTGYGFCDVRDRFIGEVVTGIQHACDEYSLDLLIYGNLAKLPSDAIHRKLTSGKTDGIVVHASPDNPVATLIGASSTPAVAIADRQPSMPSIIADDSAGMRALVDHLWRLGHRRIAFTTPDIVYESIQRRGQAYEDAMRAKGGRPAYIHIPWDDTMRAISKLMADPERPSALCCWHDDFAYYLIDVCKALGVGVPDDLALTGFDGIREGRIPLRQLCTVRVPWADMAFAATKSIVSVRDGGRLDPVRVFPVDFVHGDTA